MYILYKQNLFLQRSGGAALKSSGAYTTTFAKFVAAKCFAMEASARHDIFEARFIWGEVRWAGLGWGAQGLCTGPKSPLAEVFRWPVGICLGAFCSIKSL